MGSIGAFQVKVPGLVLPSPTAVSLSVVIRV